MSATEWLLAPSNEPYPLLRSPAAMPLMLRWMPCTTSGSVVAGAMAAQQLDLHMVQRIDVGKAAADRARQQRIALEQRLLRA